MEFSKYMDLIPKRILKETKEWVESEVFYKSKYIFIRKEEGKKLNHCVGSYAKRHAKGETNILFIRKIGEVNKSYFTVEIINNKIIQVYGFSNEKANKEVEEFIEMYKKEKLNIKNKVA